MANHPCPIHIDCPGFDSPIANYSTEAPDPDIFVAFTSGWDWIFPPLGGFWTNPRTTTFCDSTTSQADAQACANRTNLTDLTSNVGPSGGGWHLHNGNPVHTFTNSTQTCPFTCPNGDLFDWTVAAGYVRATSQALADRIAESLACQFARTNYICLGTFNPNATLGFFYSSEALISSPAGGDFFVQVVSGILPPGLTLLVEGDSMVLSGIPNTSGTFNFTLACEGRFQNSTQKAYTITVKAHCGDFLAGQTITDKGFIQNNGAEQSIIAGKVFRCIAVAGNSPDIFTTNQGVAELDTSNNPSQPTLEMQTCSVTINVNSIGFSAPAQTTYEVLVEDSDNFVAYLIKAFDGNTILNNQKFTFTIPAGRRVDWLVQAQAQATNQPGSSIDVTFTFGDG
jgi:hypothetical protein